jgi:hypothetical protein
MIKASNGIEGLVRARAKDTETRRNRVAAASLNSNGPTQH